MNFWQRRPIGENIIGLLLAAALWLAIELAVELVFLAAGYHGATRMWGSFVPVLAATIIVTKLYDRMPLAWVGIGAHRWAGREIAIGLALGAVLATIAWSPGAIAGSVARAPASTLGLVVEIVVSLVTAAVAEELIFRGYPFQRLVEILGPLSATIIASAAFALAHLGNPSVTPMAIVNLFLGSIFFSLAYFATGSLWLPMAAHAAWNLTLALVLGARVSGLDLTAGWLSTIDGSSRLVGGGDFGPEAGLAGTAALLIGIVALARFPIPLLSPYVHASVFASVYRRERVRLERSQPDAPPDPGS